MNAFTLARRAWIAASALLLAVAADVHASEQWPKDRPITWIVGFAPGGSVDVITRAIAQRVGSALGQTVVVENKPGSAGSIALANAARAEPDGYTVITMAGPILHAGKVPEIGKELQGVATLAEGAVVLVGTQGGPRDFAALADAIRREPTRFAYASSGVGTGQHLAGEMLNLALGADMVHVPYKGGGQAVSDVVGGQVQLAFLGVSTVLEQVRTGKLIAYAVTSPHRAPALPEVPTLQEAGIAGFDASQWYIAAVPSGTPQQITDALGQAIGNAVSSPEVVRVLGANGLTPPSAEALEANAVVLQSLARARKVAAEANLAIE